MAHSSTATIIIICGLILICKLPHQFVSANENMEEKKLMCPKICFCDMIDGLRRADCSGEKLINTYTDVPETVQILDLSSNQITVLDNDCLREYKNIEKLFLSENAIHTIYLDAFSRMKILKYLDLSENRLEYIDDKIFEENHELVELNLSKNKFMMLQDKPLAYSQSLLFLDLSKSQIAHIFPSTLEKMPNLLTLDLSQNLMISLSREPFVKLSKIKYINVDGNRWKCDKTMSDVLTWFSVRNIFIHDETCSISIETHHKFERMELDPNLLNQEESREDVDIELLWNTNTTVPIEHTSNAANISHEKYLTFILNKSCTNEKFGSEICEDFLTCQHKYHELFQLHSKVMDFVYKSNKMRTMSLSFVLYSGIFFGTVFGMTSMYLIRLVKDRCFSPNTKRKNVQRMRQEFRQRNNFEHSRLIDSPMLPTRNRNVRSTMIPVDRSYVDRNIYRNHENTRQFLVKLFAKRQPRYLRNCSQIADLNAHPLPTVVEAAISNNHENTSPPASVHNNNLYDNVNQTNLEHERLLYDSRRSSISVLNDLYNSEPFQSSPTNNDLERTAMSDSPPPPYKDCFVRLTY